MNKSKEDRYLEVQGMVIEPLPNRMCRVQLDNGLVVLGIISGQMQRHRIKVLEGDRVMLNLPVEDPSKGFIVRRLS